MCWIILTYYPILYPILFHLLFICSLPSISLLHIQVTPELLIALLKDTYACTGSGCVTEESASVSSNQPVIMYEASPGVV